VTNVTVALKSKVIGVAVAVPIPTQPRTARTVLAIVRRIVMSLPLHARAAWPFGPTLDCSGVRLEIVSIFRAATSRVKIYNGLLSAAEFRTVASVKKVDRRKTGALRLGSARRIRRPRKSQHHSG